MPKKINQPMSPKQMPDSSNNSPELGMCSEFPSQNSEEKETAEPEAVNSSRSTKTQAANENQPEAPHHDNPERLVFLGDALNDAAIAEEIRSLHESKKNPLLSSSARAKIEAKMYAIKEKHGGNFINIEDAVITQKGRRLTVKINNCWHDETGKPYIMRVGIEDFLNFGKPFTNESRNRVTPKSGFQAYANYTRIHVKPAKQT